MKKIISKYARFAFMQLCRIEKRLRKHYRIAIAIMLSMFLISSIQVNANSLNIISENEFLKLMEEQTNALDANQLLMDTILLENGDYPDYYGGVYISNNTLHILLTDNSMEDIEERLHIILNNYMKWVQYDKVRFSYNELYKEAENIVQSYYLDNNISCPNLGYYVDIKENSCIITVPDVKTEMLLETYMKERKTIYPVIVKVTGESVPCTSESTITEYDGDNKTRSTITLKGGNQINNSYAWFTMGYCGYYSALNAFVTCGHMQDTNAWTLLGANIGNGSILGAPSYIRFQNNGNGDFSIHNIAANTGNTILITNKIQNVSDSGSDISVTGTYSDPPVGTYIFKYNATPITNNATKYRSYCQVTATGVTVSYSGVNIKNLSSAQFVSSAGTSAGGDSGGPWFLYSGGIWKIAGIHSGSNGSTTTYFTPWKYIAAAGFSAKTY